MMMTKPEFEEEPSYSTFELTSLHRFQQYQRADSAYVLLQASKPLTLGFAMHDSPVGLLAWVADKLFSWSDAYPWTASELITWTLHLYFSGPTTGFQMYSENIPPTMPPGLKSNFVDAPTGVSAFPKENCLLPRSWAVMENNVVFWREHDKGGHWPALERTEDFSRDLIEFYRAAWKV